MDVDISLPCRNIDRRASNPPLERRRYDSSGSDGPAAFAKPPTLLKNGQRFDLQAFQKLEVSDRPLLPLDIARNLWYFPRMGSSLRRQSNLV